MDILSKINLLLNDEVSGATTTGDVEQNTAKGKVDVIGGKCPKGQMYCKRRKTCIPIPNTNESANSPKKGDRFLYKGKKLTVTHVGSGMGMDKYIDVKFDGEKHGRSINMKNFFKGNEFEYIEESSVVGGSYISGTTSNIIGSQQTRTGFTTKRKIIDLDRKEKVEVEMEDPTDTNIIGRKNLKFNKKSGAFIPDFWLEEK